QFNPKTALHPENYRTLRPSGCKQRVAGSSPFPAPDPIKQGDSYDQHPLEAAATARLTPDRSDYCRTSSRYFCLASRPTGAARGPCFISGFGEDLIILPPINTWERESAAMAAFAAVSVQTTPSAGMPREKSGLRQSRAPCVRHAGCPIY